MSSFQFSRRLQVAAAAGGTVLAVAAISGTVYALHGTASPRPAAAAHTLAPAVSASSSAPAAAQSSPAPAQTQAALAPAQTQAALAPAVQAPAPAATPAASQPPATDPLTACPVVGATAADAAGNPVQCVGASAAGVWQCNPLYPYPGPYPAVPGQAGPPGGWRTVLDTDGTAYVADVQVSGTWVWQTTSPPC